LRKEIEFELMQPANLDWIYLLKRKGGDKEKLNKDEKIVNPKNYRRKAK
jgi:hypothetical protein